MYEKYRQVFGIIVSFFKLAFGCLTYTVNSTVGCFKSVKVEKIKVLIFYSDFRIFPSRSYVYSVISIGKLIPMHKTKCFES